MSGGFIFVVLFVPFLVYMATALMVFAWGNRQGFDEFIFSHLHMPRWIWIKRICWVYIYPMVVFFACYWACFLRSRYLFAGRWDDEWCPDADELILTCWKF